MSAMPTFPVGALPLGMAPAAAQPLEEVGAEINEDPTLFHFPSSRLAFRRSLRVSIKIEGTPYKFLLDTGAELSVIHSSLLSSLPLDFSGHSPHTHSVQGFAGRDVVIKGPYSLPPSRKRKIAYKAEILRPIIHSRF